MWLVWLVLGMILIKTYNKITNGKCYSDKVMSGKVVIVTGGNSGIGYQTALELARRGAKVILGCRDEERGQNAVQSIIKKTKNRSVRYMHLDLSSFASVRKFVEDFKNSEAKLDILINNAGASGVHRDKTEDGLIRDMQVNHFGPFLLTVLLTPLLKKSAPSRIIIVTSTLHRFGTISDLNSPHSFMRTYCDSKLCNILFSNELARRLEDSDVSVNSLHPGHVNTSFYKATILEKLRTMILYTFFKNPIEGAQTSLFLAISDDCDHITGGYFVDCKEGYMGMKARNEDLAAKLWEMSEQMVGLKPEEQI
ncbi:retinol dehydrogenase 14-like [Helicoverpa zea]|uniref:retinol dehydrogenase 14-like n=1 Tax=Helicoverpa zea TaxID=7113 RepID=UPI001F591472|nr:retinol dehydrogenase 14-like [Helicoverpa zea]